MPQKQRAHVDGDWHRVVWSDLALDQSGAASVHLSRVLHVSETDMMVHGRPVGKKTLGVVGDRGEPAREKLSGLQTGKGVVEDAQKMRVASHPASEGPMNWDTINQHLLLIY